MQKISILLTSLIITACANLVPTHSSKFEEYQLLDNFHFSLKACKGCSQILQYELEKSLLAMNQKDDFKYLVIVDAEIDEDPFSLRGDRVSTRVKKFIRLDYEIIDNAISKKIKSDKILQVDSKQYLKSALSDFSSSEKLSMHLAKEAVIDLRNKLFSFSYQINKK